MSKKRGLNKILGKNNAAGYDLLNEKSTFGLRKLSVGVASVLLNTTKLKRDRMFIRSFLLGNWSIYEKN